MKGSRKHSVYELKPGMVLAKAVFSADRRTVIEKGIVLTKQQISLLSSWDVSYVEILDMGGHPGKGLSYREFENIHAAMVTALAETFERARLFNTLSPAEMDELVEQSENIITDETGVLGYLSMIQNTDDYIFKHSVNVGIIAGLIGKWIGYAGARLKGLILAGFLHDIGKTQISLQILNKPSKLNIEEWEIIKQHPGLGFELLQSTNPPSDAVLSGVRQHHEKIDGSGYPLGLSGNEITMDARIIAIADIYDSMTSDRAYRSAETPFRAIEEIYSQMFDKLDPKLSNVFIAQAREAFIGTAVRLSDGSEAIVIAIDQTTLAKPILRKRAGCYINLAQRSDLSIIKVEPIKEDPG